MRYRALLDQMTEIRGYLLQSADGLSLEQVLQIPQGFRNNVLWNIGHAITDNCSMLYPPAGQPYPLPDHYLRYFAPGTSPVDWTETPSIGDVLNEAARVRDQLVEDCVAGRMEQYARQVMDDGAVLGNIAQAIAHCNIHEAYHVGVIATYRKLLQ